jgi:microcystin-dependent protein
MIYTPNKGGRPSWRFCKGMLAYRNQAAALLLLIGGALHGEVKVLQNFTLIDGTGRAPASRQAMIIDNGRITWVGPAAQLKMPPGAETVDLACMGTSAIPSISRRTRNFSRAKTSKKI